MTPKSDNFSSINFYPDEEVLEENISNDEKIEALYEQIQVLKKISDDLKIRMESRKNFCSSTVSSLGKINDTFKKLK